MLRTVTRLPIPEASAGTKRRTTMNSFSTKCINALRCAVLLFSRVPIHLDFQLGIVAPGERSKRLVSPRERSIDDILSISDDSDEPPIGRMYDGIGVFFRLPEFARWQRNACAFVGRIFHSSSKSGCEHLTTAWCKRVYPKGPSSTTVSSRPGLRTTTPSSNSTATSCDFLCSTMHHARSSA